MRTDDRNSGYQSALFPEASPTPVTIPDWMRGIDTPVRGANFNRDAQGESHAPQEDGYFNQPPTLDNRKADHAAIPDGLAPDDAASTALQAELAEQQATLAEEREALNAERNELESARAALQESTEAVKSLLASIQTQQAVAREAIDEEIGAVALAVAEAIIGDGLDPARAEALVDAATLPLDGPVTVKVGPELGALLDGKDTSDGAGTSDASDRRLWTVDPALPPLACVAEGQSGRVLAGVEARLDAARNALEQAT